jgi:hypothetical protein
VTILASASPFRNPPPLSMPIQSPAFAGRKDLSVSCRTDKSDVEQARLSTICSTRAEFADFVPRLGFVRIHCAIQNASLFSCQRSLCLDRPDGLTPGETSARLRSQRVRNNKKPGVERRAKPSVSTRTGSRDARLIAILSS